ncbi:MAG: DUF4190 domain-containing protein [Phycisphaerae bacterium]|nr:DUF4190 domain-containing protein [Phycisphaerae bacterium]
MKKFRNKAKGFILVWGDIPLGKVDVVKRRFYVRTMFFCFMGITFAPLASYLVRLLSEDGREYYRIPMNWRSVLAGYLRAWLFASLFVTIMIGIFAWYGTSNPLWMALPALNFFLFILSLSLFRKPSENRLISYLKVMGIDVQLDSMITDIDTWLNLLGCEKVPLQPNNVFGIISLVCGLLGFVIPLLDITSILTGLYALRRGEPDRNTAKKGIIFGCIGTGYKVAIFIALALKIIH